LGELVDVFGVAETALGAALTLGADIDLVDEEDPSEDLLVKPYKPRARSAAASVDASNVDVFFLRGAGGATLFVVIFGAEDFFEKRFDDLAGLALGLGLSFFASLAFLFSSFSLGESLVFA
jgi:hypothetical protein